MTQIINRMFGTSEDAKRAVELLKENGFAEVFMVARPDMDPKVPGSGDFETADDALVDAIVSGSVSKSDAVVFAEGVRRGGTLVTVHAPYGFGLKAINLLASCNPIDLGVPDHQPDAVEWDEAAPLSSALKWPVLTDDFWTFSSLLGWRLLSAPTLYSWFGFPLLIDRPTPLSTWLGLSLLSDNPTPLSSWLKIPLLCRGGSAPPRSPNPDGRKPE